MKRGLGTMAANWLRKPENRQKIKQTAQQLWDRYQQRGRTSDTRSTDAGTRSQPSTRPDGDRAQPADRTGRGK